MMDGPKKNPQLARKMMDTFEKTGLVLMRGNREVGDHLDVMRDWANLCFPNVSKYEGGANQRHGTHVANVYEVKSMALMAAISSMGSLEKFSIIFYFLGRSSECSMASFPPRDGVR